MRIVIASDAWFPQVNGVVRTLKTLSTQLANLGHDVAVIGPDQFSTIPCPTYPQIQLACWPYQQLCRIIDAFEPSAIHIATEGPLGWAARRYCRRRDLCFTTAYHTRFPEYLHARSRLPLNLSYAVLRYFHNKAASIMVATPSIEALLRERGFKHIRRWSRGVDTDLFQPRPEASLAFNRPISLYVGRIAIEKNIEAFLKLALPGTKVVVGGGPQRKELELKYPEAQFMGEKTGDALARCYAAADVCVFPSRTDTFGLTIIEALASGVPVAAFPVPGPLDIIKPEVGRLNESLGQAVQEAMTCNPAACRTYAMTYSWEASARQFLSNLQPFDAGLGTGTGKLITSAL